MTKQLTGSRILSGLTVQGLPTHRREGMMGGRGPSSKPHCLSASNALPSSSQVPPPRGSTLYPNGTPAGDQEFRHRQTAFPRALGLPRSFPTPEMAANVKEKRNMKETEFLPADIICSMFRVFYVPLFPHCTRKATPGGCPVFCCC